jgi:hypothetical protein
MGHQNRNLAGELAELRGENARGHVSARACERVVVAGERDLGDDALEALVGGSDFPDALGRSGVAGIENRPRRVLDEDADGGDQMIHGDRSERALR